MRPTQFFNSVFFWVNTLATCVKRQKFSRVKVVLVLVIPQLQAMRKISAFRTCFNTRSSRFLRDSNGTRRITSSNQKPHTPPSCLSQHLKHSVRTKDSYTFPERSHALRLFHDYQTDNWSAKDDKQQNKIFLSKIQNSMCDTIFPNLLDGDLENDSCPIIVLLLAVSGGCDSIALLHAIMKSLDRKHEIEDSGILSTGKYYMFQYSDRKMTGRDFLCEPHVVHFDHEQRGVESTGDRAFVEDICRTIEVPFHCYSWDDTVAEGESRPFSQEVARDWRRSKLGELLKSLATKKGRRGTILTAHHKDDSNETILLKLLRGAHITNLSGIEPFAKQSGDEDISFARPMLDVTKDEVIQYLKAHNIAWREDASNASNKYKRNQVRNELMPLLSEIVGGEETLQKRLDNLAEQSREIKEDLDHRATIYLEENNQGNSNTFNLSELSKPLNLVQKEALHAWADNFMHPHTFSYTQLSRVCKQLNDYPDRRVWTLNIGGGYDLVRNGDSLCLEYNDEKESRDANNTNGALPSEPQESSLSWSKMDASTTDSLPKTSSDIVIQLPANVEKMLDNDGVNFILSNSACTPRLKFNPPWRRNRTPLKIKDFLRGQKVPLHRRSCASIVCAYIGSTVHAAAVFVESTQVGDKSSGKWIINCDFEENDEESGVKVILHGVS